MNTQQLKEFLFFAQTLNYSKAARGLFITRPTLCEHIHTLEAELGCRLVSSDKGGVRLTTAGGRFIKDAQDVLGAWDRTCARYQGLAKNLLVVTVAATNLPWLETLLYRARRALRDTHPSLEIEIATENGALASVEALQTHASDIVVAGYKSFLPREERPHSFEEMHAFALDTEEIQLLMTPESPLFSRRDVTVRDLDGTTFVLPPDIFRSWTRDHVVDFLAAHGARVSLRTLDFADHSEYFTYDFGKALGIIPTTLVPRFGISEREELRCVGISDVPLRTSFFAVFDDDFVASENGRLLFETMRELAPRADA